MPRNTQELSNRYGSVNKHYAANVLECITPVSATTSKRLICITKAWMRQRLKDSIVCLLRSSYVYA